MKKLKSLLSASLLMAFASFGLLTLNAPIVSADIQNELCAGATLSVDSDCTQADIDSSTAGIDDLITDAINIFSWIIGIISVVMIMVGGVKYITSQGSSDNVTSAKNTILYAVIGLVVVALAQTIVRFVLKTAIDQQG